MSERRAQRLAATAITVLGAAACVIQATGTFDFGDGSIVFLAAPIVGIARLISLRPRNK